MPDNPLPPVYNRPPPYPGWDDWRGPRDFDWQKWYGPVQPPPRSPPVPPAPPPDEDVEAAPVDYGEKPCACPDSSVSRYYIQVGELCCPPEMQACILCDEVRGFKPPVQRVTEYVPPQPYTPPQSVRPDHRSLPTHPPGRPWPPRTPRERVDVEAILAPYRNAALSYVSDPTGPGETTPNIPPWTPPVPPKSPACCPKTVDLPGSDGKMHSFPVRCYTIRRQCWDGSRTDPVTRCLSDRALQYAHLAGAHVERVSPNECCVDGDKVDPDPAQSWFSCRA